MDRILPPQSTNGVGGKETSDGATNRLRASSEWSAHSRLAHRGEDRVMEVSSELKGHSHFLYAIGLLSVIALIVCMLIVSY